MSRIIDNEDLQLLQVLKEVLPSSRQLDACVGYFNLRGWQSLRTELHAMQNHDDIDDSPERVRLLVGMALSGADQTRRSLSLLSANEEEMGRPAAAEMAKAAVREFAEQLTWGTPNQQDKVGLNQLLEDLKSGYLKIKFAARNPLHAKLYVCHLEGNLGGYRAIVGSSNFTAAGLHHQGELNLEESDVQQGKKLYTWFRSKWDDTFSIDITPYLIEVLENCWATIEQPNPRLVHLKMAYELSRDARAGKNLEIPEIIAAKLTPWQESAVRVATRMLKQRGLAVIGDVVGLGKTLTGTAIAGAYGERVLVICPKNLELMWLDHLSKNDVLGDVLPISMVKNLKDMRAYKLVMIDESHNLRHTTHKGWEAVRTYVQNWNSDVVLLTATMFNADHFDISGQLKLKLATDLDLGIRPEELIKSLGDNGEWQLAQKTNGRLSTLDAFEQSPFAKDWQRLLGQYLVRRTRKYLEETYGKVDPETGKIYFEFRNGTRFSFPKRIAEPLKYQGGPNDPGDRLASVENFDALDGMHFARYQPGRYLLENPQPADKDEKHLIDDMMRANSTNGFIKTTVLKRLASSPMAFFITVEKMLLRAHVLKYALDNYLDVPIGTLDDRAYVISDTDEGIDEDANLPEDGIQPNQASSWARGYTEEKWMQLAAKTYANLHVGGHRGLRWARHELFDAKKFSKDVASDNAVLQAIVDEFGDWDPAHDSKLLALADRVNNLAKGEKLLVFSEYKDTIDYVYKYLVPLCPSVEIGVVSGASDNPSTLARRFSPVSNEDLGGLPSGSTELQVLLATDVLSEGQNLQDSALVLNWDLPWTIIKIIQRAGRVDRIGQKSDVIRALSFMPHEGVDDRITLIKRLARRLKTNQEIFGGGENFFNMDFGDEDYDLEGLFDGAKELENIEGEVDYGSYALGIWDGASQAERKLAIELPIGVSTTKKVVDGDYVSLVHTKVTQTEQAPVDLIAAMDRDGKITTLTQLEALKLTATEAFEEAGEEFEEHLLNVPRIVLEAIAPQAKQTKVLLNLNIRKNIYTLLVEYSDKHEVTPQRRELLGRIATELLEFTIFKHAEDKAREIYRARLRQGEEAAIDSLIELYENGELLDKLGGGSTQLEVVLSFGFAS
jgi:hypothetical protein